MFRHSRLGTCARGFGLVLIVVAFGCQTNPEVAKQEYLKSGDRYVADKKYFEAIVQYRNALQQDPKFGEARRKLAETYITIGDADNGFREYIRAADLLPNDVDLQVKAASLLLLAKQFEDAKTRAELVLDKDPKNIQAQIIRGNALGGLNEFDAAIKQLEAANKLEPSAGAYAAIGAIKGRAGEQTDAERAFRAAVKVDPKNVLAHLALANYLMSVSRAADAEAALKDALALEPDNAMANRGMVALYMASNRVAGAEPHLKTLAAHDTSPEATWKIALADLFAQTRRQDDALKILEPLGAQKASFAASRTRIAAIQYLKKQAAQAHQTIDDVLQREPKNVAALVLKARFFVTEGRMDDALKSAQTATGADPQSVEAQYVLGMIQLQRKQPEAAAAAFTEVLKLNPRAVPAQLQLSKLNLAAGRTEASLSLAEDAAKAVPQNALVQLNLARNLVARNEIARAKPIVTQLVAQFPNAAAAHALAGTMALAQKDATSARASYGKALAIDSMNMEALTGLSTIDVAQKNSAQARARVEAALAKNPTSPDLLILAGRTYASVGDPAAAEAALKKALKFSPNSLQTYALLGQLYVSQKKLDQAIAEYEEIARQETNPVAARTLVAMLLEAQGKQAEARRRYEEILRLDPNAPVAANNLAYIYADAGGNLDVALQLVQTAKQKLPELPEVNDTLGFVYLKKDLASLAVPPLESSVQKDPANSLYQYHLGMAYVRTGEKAKAKSALERALKLNPSFSGADDARRLLATVTP